MLDKEAQSGMNVLQLYQYVCWAVNGHEGGMLDKEAQSSSKIYLKSSATGHENPGTTSSPDKVSS